MTSLGSVSPDFDVVFLGLAWHFAPAAAALTPLSNEVRPAPVTSFHVSDGTPGSLDRCWRTARLLPPARAAERFAPFALTLQRSQ